MQTHKTLFTIFAITLLFPLLATTALAYDYVGTPISGEASPVQGVDFSPAGSGELMAFTHFDGADGRLVVHNVSDPSASGQIGTSSDIVEFTAVSYDLTGDTIFVGSGGMVQVFSPTASWLANINLVSSEVVRDLTVSNDGSLLAVALPDGFEVYNLSDSSQLLIQVDNPDYNVESISFSKDDSLFVIGGEDFGELVAFAEVYNTNNWTVHEKVLDGSSVVFTAVEFGFDHLATGNDDATLQLRPINNLTNIEHSITSGFDAVGDIDFFSDMTHVLFSINTDVHIADVTTGVITSTFTESTGFVNTLAQNDVSFNSTGSFLAYGGNDNVYVHEGGAATANPPTVENPIEFSKTHESMHVGAEVTSDGGATVTERGFVYSTSPNPTLVDNVFVEGSGLGMYDANITGLDFDTTYHVRGYATNSEGTSFTEDITVHTDPTVPEVSFTNLLAFDHESAHVEGEVTSDGAAFVTDRGFVYSTSPNPDMNDNVVSEGGAGMGVFDTIVQNLSAETTYYFRAYATNSEGTTVSSNEHSFTTSATPILPELADISVDGVYDNKTVLNLTLFSEILSEGSSNVSEHGFLWSNESFPNTNNESVTFMGGGLVEFNHTIQLEAGQTYYLLAYATNEEGTGYSEEAPITVEEEQPPAETPVGLVALLTALIGVFAVVIVLGVVLNMVQEQTTVHNNIMRKIVMITFLLILTGILIMQFGHFLI